MFSLSLRVSDSGYFENKKDWKFEHKLARKIHICLQAKKMKYVFCKTAFVYFLWLAAKYKEWKDCREDAGES